MAATSVNIYSPLSRLRNDNHSLLEQLQRGQDDIWNVLKKMQSTRESYPTRTYGETSFTYRGTDRTPLRVSRKVDHGNRNTGQTSTPKSYGQALIADGNERRNRTPIVPTSILSTPSNRKKVRYESVTCTSVYMYVSGTVCEVSSVTRIRIFFR